MEKVFFLLSLLFMTMIFRYEIMKKFPIFYNKIQINKTKQLKKLLLSLISIWKYPPYY